uniref:Uncharacterized protein n=1 Tax=Acrobeloides nanus TaxID=290746 RepID=A0A914CRB1_9BILA
MNFKLFICAIIFTIFVSFGYACRNAEETQACATALAACGDLCNTGNGEFSTCKKRCIDNFASPICKNAGCPTFNSASFGY